MSDARTILKRMTRGERFSWAEVSTWIENGDVELRGAAFEALTSKQRAVDGDIQWARADAFLVEYLISAMQGATASAVTFPMLPYLAAHALAHLYKHARSRMPPRESVLRPIRAELARLYLSGDESQRRCVVDGALEHIFESVTCRPDFDGWKADPLLAVAAQEAAEWADSQPQLP
jgi:hypothetical protein